MSAPESPSPLRLFIALQPPEGAVEGWRRWWERQPQPNQGKPTPWSQWHLTLAFMASAPPEKVAAVAQVLTGLTPSELGLAGWGSFVGQGTLWFWRVDDESAVRAIGDEVRRRLLAAEISFDPRSLKPHITLWRRAESGFQPAAPPPSLRYPGWRLALVASTLTHEGASHRVLARSDDLFPQ